jgi:hypothetical protein
VKPKGVLLTAFVFCLLVVLTGCTAGEMGNRLAPPSFGEVQNNSFPLKALTKVNGIIPSRMDHIRRVGQLQVNLLNILAQGGTQALQRIISVTLPSNYIPMVEA